ncbi:Ribose 5-phosphate isomerase B [hydrothermal vent metagenome]|uniref:Ribose 5-phosphate isomerase B n=1 Tax=hydrothermal vent metagenome TaxID=652676 RepID=A0A3B0TF56_9ZZZZ
MKVFIGADHRGQKFKKKIIKILETDGYVVVDQGALSEDVPSDYPKIAARVGTSVVKTKNSRGILLCMSGVGISIAANKVFGVRAALCHNIEAARLSREHNNANVLVLASKFMKMKDLPKMLRVWLSTSFEGGRHARRVNQIRKIEKENLKLRKK